MTMPCGLEFVEDFRISGISRCGMTICAGLLCGFSRKFAVKYSYRLSIPAVLGSLFLELGQFTTPR
ncbi:MAG: undecaprenyl-diphosphate phosphatase [Ruminococcus sp.]